MTYNELMDELMSKVNGGYTTEDGYFVDGHDSGWRGQRNDDYVSGRWSPGNPAARQLAFAANKQDYKAILQAAIDWEIAQSNYNQQLADSERLRDEQRDYDDPASVIARSRAAGINPDIAGGASGSPGSGGSSPIGAPTMAETDISTPLSSPYATLQNVFSGIQSVSSVVSSISSALDIGINFAEKVATWDDRMTISRNAAIKSDQNVSQGSLDLVDNTLDLIGSLVSRLDGTKEYSDDDLSAYYTDWTGQKDEDGSAVRRMRNFMASPQMQQEYADRALSAKRSKATYQALPFDFLTTQAENYWKIQRYQSNFDTLFSGFRSAYAKLFYTDDNASLQASSDSQMLSNQNELAELGGEQIQQQRVEFEEYLSNYAHGLTFIKDEVNRLNMEIKAVEALLESNEPTINRPELRNRLLSLQLERYQINAVGASNYNAICNLMLKHGSTQYHYDTQFQIVRNSSGKVTSTGLRVAKFQENNLLWNATMWSQAVQNNYGKNDFLNTLVGILPVVGYVFGKGISSSPTTRPVSSFPSSSGPYGRYIGMD